ncbi:hypothetical protein Bca52824_042032 [Brassica carinata]|uniref:Uncharacterized protein n=1 Tax=Brassica carinata TaxID=52824 RepID=A0A8X7RWK0_BRACI|nr:hypothetical protein Bca52824_042032 [Brassica carinata]
MTATKKKKRMMMMNGAIEAEIFPNCTNMSVLQRHRARLRYHHHLGFFSNSSTVNSGDSDGFLTTTGLDLPEIYGETTMESNARLNVAGKYNVCNEKKVMMNRGVVFMFVHGEAKPPIATALQNE